MNWEWMGTVFATTITGVGGVSALVWCLGRILRPWMRNEAREATGELYKVLRDNDFQSLGETVRANGQKIDRVETDLRADMKAMETGIRTDLRADMNAMEQRLGDRIERVGEQMGERIERLELEGRIISALSHSP